MKIDFIMKTKDDFASELERTAHDVLPNFLKQVSGLRIEKIIHEVSLRQISDGVTKGASPRTYRPDLEVVVALGSDKWHLYVEVSGQVNEKKRQLLSAYVRGLPNAIPVLFVPYLSAEAIAVCKTNNVCCVDSAGNGLIVLGSRVYIERVGSKASPAGKSRVFPTLAAPKTENVLRVLLNASGAERRVWRLKPLASEAGVSLGQAARGESPFRGDGSFGSARGQPPRRRLSARLP